jgi:hypothetical protein
VSAQRSSVSPHNQIYMDEQDEESAGFSDRIPRILYSIREKMYCLAVLKHYWLY